MTQQPEGNKLTARNAPTSNSKQKVHDLMTLITFQRNTVYFVVVVFFLLVIDRLTFFELNANQRYG